MTTHLQPKPGIVKPEKVVDGFQKVVVAVKASKDITRSALVWALTHVAQPGDCITLLVVVPTQRSGRKLWGFPRFAGDCASGHKWTQANATFELKSDISDSCSQMMLQLHDVYDSNKINVKIKVVSESPYGTVAVEAKKVLSSWVVLDKQLKHEAKRCMEELQCNIVVMKHSQPKVLRLNLVGSSVAETQVPCSVPLAFSEDSMRPLETDSDCLDLIQGPNVTPTSSPDAGTTFTGTEVGTSSVSSSDPGTSPFFRHEINHSNLKIKANLKSVNVEPETEYLSRSGRAGLKPWMQNILGAARSSLIDTHANSLKPDEKAYMSTTQALLEKFSKLDMETNTSTQNYKAEIDYNGNVRETISLSRHVPPGPPPLCSICQHKAPVFGKPPRWFSYSELELATDGFSQANFLAEGGFGSVHRGVLPDGLVVAVKQHKLASSQGDQEFCSEVEVLSCAQHRNVVMLIGFCVEDRRRLLVYEYVCNGSLDAHLYGRQRPPLEWSSRYKIAIGAARGLRYLHEECRVGCIVHRDMRPNNILITHDFEPMVGDFGLARWQPDGNLGVDTRIIGTFGYLAPEYAQSGQITEKADVYSFGVVLVELVTGRKAVDINRPKGQQCLTEWARPLLDNYAVTELLDPRLGHKYSDQEVRCMLRAASLCIRRDPHVRPRMSQVLRMLEGDILMEPNYPLTPRHDRGSRSGRVRSDVKKPHSDRHSSPVPKGVSEAYGGRLSYGVLRTPYWGREKIRRPCSEHD